MPTGWRITKTRYASTAFSGEGARIYGGRWGSPGGRIVYTSGTRALAILEVIVHIDNTSLLTSFSMCSVNFDDAQVEQFDRTMLPANWRDFPAPAVLQQIGDAWLRSRRTVILKVPSAVEGSEINYLINPDHPDFSKLTFDPCQPYPFDQRLVRS